MRAGPERVGVGMEVNPYTVTRPAVHSLQRSALFELLDHGVVPVSVEEHTQRNPGVGLVQVALVDVGGVIQRARVNLDLVLDAAVLAAPDETIVPELAREKATEVEDAVELPCCRGLLAFALVVVVVPKDGVGAAGGQPHVTHGPGPGEGLAIAGLGDRHDPVAVLRQVRVVQEQLHAGELRLFDDLSVRADGPERDLGIASDAQCAVSVVGPVVGAEEPAFAVGDTNEEVGGRAVLVEHDAPR